MEKQAGPCCRQNTDPIPNFSAVEDLARGSKGPGSLGIVPLEQIREARAPQGSLEGMDSYSTVLNIGKLVSTLGHEPPSIPRVELRPSSISLGH